MGALAERLVRNTLFTTAGHIVSLLVGLALVPYILSVLGAEQFGIWVLLAVATTYFSLLDGGVSSSFIKHLAEAQTLGNGRRRNDIVATGWLFYVIFSLLIVTVGVMIQDGLLGFLSIPGDVTLVYWGILLIFAVRNSFVVYRSMLYALQRLDVLNLIEIATALLGAAATVAALSAGYGLHGLVAVSLGMAVVHVAAEAFMAHRLCPGLVLAPHRASLRVLRPLFRYGIQLQASRCAELVHLHVDKLLLGHFVGLIPVAMYELGAKVAGLTRTLPAVLVPAILPAAAALEAERRRVELLRLYERGSKYLVALALPLALFTIINARTIIDVWLGHGDFAGAVLAVRVLAVAYLFHLLMGMGLAVARGIGIVQYEMRALMVSALLNVGLSLLLVTRYGLSGVLAATAVSTMIGYGFFMHSLHAHLKLAWGAFARNVYALPAAGAVIAAAAVVVVNSQIGLMMNWPDGSRLTGLLLLAIDSALFGLIYGAVMLKSRYIAMGDLQLVRKAFASFL